MAIKILTGENGPQASSDGESDDIIGELVNGYGTVPAWTDLNAIAIRSDDPEVPKAIAKVVKDVTVEEYDGKRPYYAILDEEATLSIAVDYISTEMVLRSRAYKKVRQCDGETMTDGEPCACAMNYEPGSREFRSASKDGLACTPEGLVFFRIPGLEISGKFVFSKSNWTAVPNFMKLEEQSEGMKRPFETSVGLKLINGQDHSWNIPTFTAPKEFA